MSAIDTGMYYPIVLRQLPPSWQVVYAGEVCDEVRTGFACGRHSAKNGGVPHLRPMNISRNGKIDFGVLKFVDPGTDGRRLSASDVLFNNTNSPELIGKTTLVTASAEGLAFSNHMTRVRFNDAITPAFGAYQLHYLWMAGYFLHKCVKHVNQASISSREFVRSIPIIVAPLGEQRRITTKIDKLYSELDKGIEILEMARIQLTTYRRAVLKQAFEGRLTAQWRDENKDRVQPTDQIIERIRVERALSYREQLRQWENDLDVWMDSGKIGKRPLKPRNPLRTRGPKPDATINQANLPTGWLRASVGTLFDIVSGGTPKGIHRVTGGEIPYYKVGDMNTPGNEVEMKTATISLSREVRTRLGLAVHPRGTIIFPKRGGAILTNKKRLLSVPSCFDLNTMGVINRCRSISNEYLWLWFQTLNLKEICDGSNVPQINNRNIEPLEFPICGEVEQNETVKILSSTISNIDRAISDIDAQLKNGPALRQAILKRAFSGRLVSQESSEELVSALLARIRIERQVGRKDNSLRKIAKRHKARVET